MKYLKIKKEVAMKKIVINLSIFALIIGSCGQTMKKQEIAEDILPIDTMELVDTIKSQNNENTYQWKTSFKNVSEVVNNYGDWINQNEKDSTASLALVFALHNNDTLSVCYSAECWLYFPYKLKDDKIIVYWDVYIDTKYEFDIVKAMKKTNKKLIGKPFMILELENDSTLKATYLMKDLIKKINRASKTKRIFFPDKYYVIEDIWILEYF